MKARSTPTDGASAPGTAPRACYSVAEFCEAHRISRSHFYDLARQGSGPKIMKAGKSTLISVEAAAEWRQRMEANTAATMGADA